MKRHLDKNIETRFISHELWTSKIKMDCENQSAFLAIRDNRVDIYHKGGKLFGYDKNGFKTHLKYASVIASNGQDYLTSKELANYQLASDFKTNYKRIKENCSKYSGIEALGVSDIYHKHSYLSNSDVVVLDIEVSLESLDEGKKQDRIDILFLNKSTKTLQFVEAKHFSNKEIWSENTPEVINQVSRYEAQIEFRKKEILMEYSKYIRTINRIFGISLPEPIAIDSNVTLMIFGFDNDQKNGRLKTLITDNSQFSGIKCYSIGNVKKIKTENLWNAKFLNGKK